MPSLDPITEYILNEYFQLTSRITIITFERKGLMSKSHCFMYPDQMSGQKSMMRLMEITDTGKDIIQCKELDSVQYSNQGSMINDHMGQWAGPWKRKFKLTQMESLKAKYLKKKTFMVMEDSKIFKKGETYIQSERLPWTFKGKFNI